MKLKNIYDSSPSVNYAIFLSKTHIVWDVFVMTA